MTDRKFGLYTGPGKRPRERVRVPKRIAYEPVPFRAWFESIRAEHADCDECNGWGEYVEDGRKRQCRYALSEYRAQVRRDRERWVEREGTAT